HFARVPADEGSISPMSLDQAQELNSYKLPITRNGATKTRVAYNYWSGEYPMPVIDVNSYQSGTTKIDAQSSLRETTGAKQSCTIRNGVYHPWSSTPNSVINYYSLSNADDFLVIKAMKIQDVVQSANQKTRNVALEIPVGAKFVNVTYGSENYCGATLIMGKRKIAVFEGCDFFYDNKTYLKQTTPKDDFQEQWLYLACQEKDAQGKALKLFVKDSDLMAQEAAGIKMGCIQGYGSATGANDKACFTP
ncbi:MAG: hypothetical protein V4736_13215, partial [Bdellovibrionota bacterium]